MDALDACIAVDMLVTFNQFNQTDILDTLNKWNTKNTKFVFAVSS